MPRAPSLKQAQASAAHTVPMRHGARRPALLAAALLPPKAQSPSQAALPGPLSPESAQPLLVAAHGALAVPFLSRVSRLTLGPGAAIHLGTVPSPGPALRQPRRLLHVGLAGTELLDLVSEGLEACGPGVMWDSPLCTAACGHTACGACAPAAG